MKLHAVTGEEVPDETARVPVVRYVNPRKAVWPEADFVVGNPPFIGNWRMRSALGDGYAETVREVHPDVSESCDYVMYWWDHAAELARQGAIRRFGFITTNSLRQTFSRRVLAHHMAAKDPVSLVFAIPDHPWVIQPTGGGANCDDRGRGGQPRRAAQPRGERERRRRRRCRGYACTERRQIQADLTIGANVAGADALQANQGLSCRVLSCTVPGSLSHPRKPKVWGSVEWRGSIAIFVCTATAVTLRQLPAM